MDTTQQLAHRYATQMRLFEHAGVIHYGLWRQWQKATKEVADQILFEFRASCYA